MPPSDRENAQTGVIDRALPTDFHIAPTLVLKPNRQKVTRRPYEEKQDDVVQPKTGSGAHEVHGVTMPMVGLACKNLAPHEWPCYRI